LNTKPTNQPQIGVVGRTGSGKTTLLMALFRLLDLAGGRVVVDGVDIATLPLKEVRLGLVVVGFDIFSSC